MVFSLNVTGYLVNDIFRVVHSIRYRLYGLSLGKNVLEIISHLINMNDMIFTHFLAEKKNLLHKKNMVQQIQHFWLKYTSQRVLNQIPGSGDYNKQPLPCKFQGGGGSKVKVPSVGGMDIYSGTAQWYMCSVFYWLLQCMWCLGWWLLARFLWIYMHMW